MDLRGGLGPGRSGGRRVEGARERSFRVRTPEGWREVGIEQLPSPARTRLIDGEPLDARSLAAFAGTYRASPGDTFTVSAADDRLRWEMPIGHSTGLFQISPTEFLFLSGDLRRIRITGEGEAVLLRRDGTTRRARRAGPSQKTAPSSAGEDENAGWTPDGEWIVFDSRRNGKWGVWVMRPDGSGQQQILRRAGWGVFNARLRPPQLPTR